VTQRQFSSIFLFDGPVIGWQQKHAMLAGQIGDPSEHDIEFLSKRRNPKRAESYMTTSTIEALRRADRLLAKTILLVASFSAGIVLGSNAPSTDKVAAGTTQAVHAAVQIAHGAEVAALKTGQSILTTGHEAASVVSILPISVVSPTSPLTQPLGAITAPQSATELALLRMLADQRCLAEAMYYEARGEGAAGEEAIAEVVFHRTHARGYPRTICGVVYEGASLGACQFSFACHGEGQRPKEWSAWHQARMLAAKIMAGAVPLENVTEDAISFHAIDVEPGWNEHLQRTIQIGNHVFYRRAVRIKAS
jgi:hypothetical protein